MSQAPAYGVPATGFDSRGFAVGDAGAWTFQDFLGLVSKRARQAHEAPDLYKENDEGTSGWMEDAAIGDVRCQAFIAGLSNREKDGEIIRYASLPKGVRAAFKSSLRTAGRAAALQAVAGLQTSYTMGLMLATDVREDGVWKLFPPLSLLEAIPLQRKVEDLVASQLLADPAWQPEYSLGPKDDPSQRYSYAIRFGIAPARARILADGPKYSIPAHTSAPIKIVAPGGSSGYGLGPLEYGLGPLEEPPTNSGDAVIGDWPGLPGWPEWLGAPPPVEEVIPWESVDFTKPGWPMKDGWETVLRPGMPEGPQPGEVITLPGGYQWTVPGVSDGLPDWFSGDARARKYRVGFGDEPMSGRRVSSVLRNARIDFVGDVPAPPSGGDDGFFGPTAEAQACFDDYERRWWTMALWSTVGPKGGYYSFLTMPQFKIRFDFWKPWAAKWKEGDKDLTMLVAQRSNLNGAELDAKYENQNIALVNASVDKYNAEHGPTYKRMTPIPIAEGEALNAPGVADSSNAMKAAAAVDQAARDARRKIEELGEQAVPYVALGLIGLAGIFLATRRT